MHARVRTRRPPARPRLATLAAAACLALAVGPLGPCPARAQPPAAGGRTPVPVTLENGFQVLVVENHSVPMATAKVVVRTGAMTQGEDDQGVPHLFEHMLFKGYRGIGGRPFAYETAELLAGYNGTTAEELVTYYVTMPSARIADGVRLLAGLVRDPRFDAGDLRTERFVVLGEMQRDDSDPRALLRREVAQTLWGAGWPRKNTIGQAAALLGVTPKRLTEIYQRYYVPNNAALVVTGDVSAAGVVEAARKHFASWRRRADPFAAAPVAPMPALDSSRAVVLTADVEAVTLLLQWQGPGVRDDPSATYAADALADVVNDDESAFMRRLVHDGLFQTARIGHQTLVHTGPVTFAGTTTVEQLPAALTALSAELLLMRGDGYFEPRALATAAKRRRVARSFEREEGVTLAHALADAWAVTGLPYHATYADSLAARRPADLTRFAARYLGEKPFVVGVLVPTGKEAEVAAMLRQFLDFMREEK